jgi:UDP-glucose 4-epimerase
MRGEQIEIWGNPQKAKEIVYVYDCVSVIEKSIESELDGGIYNVGGLAPITLEEQIRGIIEVFCPKDKQSKVIYCPDKSNEREFAADITKTRRELGYIPQWTYLQGLYDMKEKMKSAHFSKLWGILDDYKDNLINI